MRFPMELFLVSLIGYLIGAVPFAYVIGKAFYHTDVRQHGSGNLGGSNTGRVLGKKAGLAVMTLDLLKATLSVYLATKISAHPWAVSLAALFTAIGHCYPVFLRFHGGKAVAALYGFLFALWVVGDCSPLVFFLPLMTFLAVLAAFKIVSLSSILSACAAVICIMNIDIHRSVLWTTAILTVLIVLRHHENISRMLSGTERKIKWMNRKDSK